MKRLLSIATLLFYSVIVQGQIVRAFTPRYSNTSVTGNIVYLSNSIISTNGIGSGSPGTGEVPPGGTTTDNGSYGINIDIDNVITTLQAYGGNWKYWDANSRPANWETVAFDDTGWPTGTAQFGWGQATPSPNVTCMNSGCASSCPSPPGSCNTRTPAYYFRKVVSITPSSYTAIR